MVLEHFVVDTDRRRGGLALLWSSNININVILYLVLNIKVNIFNDDSHPIWRFMDLYGHLTTSNRWHT